MRTISVKIRKSRFMADEYSAYVSFPYSEDILNTIRSMKKRSWIKGSKEWEIPIAEIRTLLREYNDCVFDISGTYVDLSPKKLYTADMYDFKTKPFKHQIEGFEYGMNHDRWLLGDEMGLGKTKQVIDIACGMKKEKGFSHCLIICGVNGLKWNWYYEVSKHSDETAYILGQRVKKRTGQMYVGSNKDKVHDLECLEDNPSYFIITNVETLRDDGIFNQIRYWLHSENDCKINMIAIDEAHKAIKNPSSQQGKATLKLDADYRIAMTGTPMMNNPLDLYGILRWLGYEKHSFYTFKNYYAVMGGYGGYEIIGYKHLDELEEQLQDIMLRRLKSDVLDLPEKTYVDEYVEMLPKQSIIYKEVKSDIKANIDMLTIAPNPLAEMIRLRQATGYTGILSSEIQCSAKLDRMEEIISDATENGQKVIVFSNWTSIIDAAYDRLKDRRPLVITGETPDYQRQEYVDDFQTFANHSIMLGTSGALGTGVTLTAATVVIFLDHPWSRALYEQCVDRAHRVGQKNNITIYNIMCQDTIDVRIWELVNKKGEMSDAIVDGKIAGPNKAELINFLLS